MSRRNKTKVKKSEREKDKPIGWILFIVVIAAAIALAFIYSELNQPSEEPPEEKIPPELHRSGLGFDGVTLQIENADYSEGYYNGIEIWNISVPFITTKEYNNITITFNEYYKNGIMSKNITRYVPIDPITGKTILVNTHLEITRIELDITDIYCYIKCE